MGAENPVHLRPPVVPPSGWSVVPLGQLAQIQTGIAKGARDLVDPVEVPYLRVANVQDGYLDLDEVKTLAVERSRIERYRLRPGDVLLTEGGDVDKLGRGTVWDQPLPLCLHQNHVFVVRPDPQVMEPAFLSALAGSEYGRRYFADCAKQTTNLASINTRQLRAFPVLVPPLHEQRRIVAALAVVDEVIARGQAVVEQLGVVRQALLEQLMRRGMPHQRHRLQPTPIGPLPCAWEVVELGELAESMFVGIASAVTQAYVATGGVPLVRTADLRDGCIDDAGLVRISSTLAHERRSKALLAGDVVSARTGAPGKSAVVPETLQGAHCFSLLVTRPGPRLSGRFLCHVMSASRGQEIVARGKAGGVQQNLNVSVLRRALIGLPPLDEQARICDALDRVDADRAAERQVVAGHRQVRAVMLRELLAAQLVP